MKFYFITVKMFNVSMKNLELLNVFLNEGEWSVVWEDWYQLANQLTASKSLLGVSSKVKVFNKDSKTTATSFFIGNHNKFSSISFGPIKITVSIILFIGMYYHKRFIQGVKFLLFLLCLSKSKNKNISSFYGPY